ncbi:MAG: ribbon-helix-helix protein, CopG family [Thermoplasmatales archaeon]
MKVQFNIKIEKRDLTLLQKVASERGEGSSDFVRRAIRKELARLGFLNKEQMKALGVIQA